jgi:hypothetical protein
MERFCLIFIILALHGFVVGQSKEIEWTEPIKNSGQINQLLSFDDSEIISIKTTNNQLFPATVATKYRNGKVLLSKKIPAYFDHKLFDLYAFVSFNNLLTGIYTDKSNGETIVYAVQFDDFLDPIASPFQLLSVGDNNLYKGSPFFSVQLSDNNQHLAVAAFLTAKKNGFDYLQYKVFDSSFSVEQLGDFEFPSISSKTLYSKSAVSDDGSFYFSYLLYNASISATLTEQIGVEKTTIVYCEKSKQHAFDLRLDNKKIGQFDCVKRDSLLLITGTYGEGYTTGVKGFFYQRINTNSKEIEKELFSEFPTELLNEEQLTNRHLAADNKELSTNTRTEFYNYQFRAIVPLKDSAIIVVAEQVFVNQIHLSDGRGMMQTVRHFYFNNVIIYKLSSDGKLDWFTKVAKEQISSNDYGYFSSVNVLVKQASLQVFFNDDMSFYNDFGEYEDAKYQRSVFFPIAKKHACLAQTTIQFNTGKQTRIVSCYANESEGVVVPKFSVIDKKRKVSLFFAEGRVEAIGVKRFDF